MALDVGLDGLAPERGVSRRLVIIPAMSRHIPKPSSSRPCRSVETQSLCCVSAFLWFIIVALTLAVQLPSIEQNRMAQEGTGLTNRLADRSGAR
jgi:hypothetical protein